MKMSKEERLMALEEAQELLFEAIELIESVFPDNGRVDNYLIAPLKIHASRSHGYLSRDLNLDDLIEQIQDEEDEEDY